MTAARKSRAPCGVFRHWVKGFWHSLTIVHRSKLIVEASRERSLRVVSVMTVIEARAAVGARKWWALAGLSLAVLAVSLDATVLSVALPTLAVSLHASAADLQWFVSSYTLALAVALLPGGLLGTGSAARR